MNEGSSTTTVDTNLHGGFRNFLKKIQNRISTSPYSYLAYTFIIPVCLMYLLYLSMGIRPFGDGSVLVLDLNGQYVYFFESLRNTVYGEGSFLYTFSRALGGEYMGMYAYYLASPLSYIVCLFPKERILEALLTIILLKTGLCGFSFGFYLHKSSKHSNKIAVVAFSVLYSLCAFAVVHQNNVMWIDALIWLPIITYSIEQLIVNKKYKLFVVSLAMTVMSNYYIGYMVCIYAAIYFLYYYFSKEKSEINPNNQKYHWLITALKFCVFALIAVAISAVIIFSAYYSLTFGKNDFSNPNWGLKAKFDILDFLTKFLPGTYDTVRPEGLPFVYCGLLTLIMVPVYFMTKAIRSREKLASLALICFFVLCFIASPLDLIWHGFQNPNWLNYRYSFMLCFILLILGYKGYGNLRRFNEKFILAICAFIILFVSICQKLDFETYVVSSESIETFQTVWLTIIITIALFALLCLLIRTANVKKREGITAILATVICIEVFLNGLGLMVRFDDDVVYSGYSSYNNFVSGLQPVVDEIKERDTSFYRFEKTMIRKNNDNMALGIRGLSNSTSTLNSNTIAFLDNMGYTSRSHLSKYLGGNPVNDSLLGIKYLIDNKDSDSLSHYYDYEFTNGNYDVYKNPYSLSIAYGVDSGITDFDFDDYFTKFEKLNGFVTELCGSDEKIDIFKPISEFEEESTGCTVSNAYSQTTYTAKDDNITSSVTFTFEAKESAEYYFYTPSNKPEECYLYVNGENLGKYLGSDTRHIFSLGWFEKGESIEVEIRLIDAPLSILNNYSYLWYIDREVFDEIFTQLSNNPKLVIESEFTDDHLIGNIDTIEDDTTIMTTIPYDKGWNVYVDGVLIETYEVVNALIAFDISEAGKHSVELVYSPRIYRMGITVSIAGLTLFLLICLIEFVIKKTVFKRYTSTNKTNYWILEDFDEDYEQSLLPTLDETLNHSKKKFYFKTLIFPKKNENTKKGEK